MYLLDDAKQDTLFFAGDTALVGDTHHMVERGSGKRRELDLALSCPSDMRRGGSPAFERDTSRTTTR